MKINRTYTGAELTQLVVARGQVVLLDIVKC